MTLGNNAGEGQSQIGRPVSNVGHQLRSPNRVSEVSRQAFVYLEIT
jgi:hypothetical protein